MSARAWKWLLAPAAGVLIVIMTRKLRQRCTAPAALETTGVRARTMRAIVWLQVSLRLSDNEAIASAASRADELIICVVWRHGRNCIPTAAAAFEAAAIAALDRSLQPLGQRVCVLYAAAGGGGPEAAAAAVAELASRARVDEIIVDGSGAAGAASTDHLQAELAALASRAHSSTHALLATSEEPWLTKLLVQVHATSEEPWLLLPSKYALRALGRSRAGGGGKVLRWAAFLKACMDDTHALPAPLDAPNRLPPPPSSWRRGARHGAQHGAQHGARPKQPPLHRDDDVFTPNTAPQQGDDDDDDADDDADDASRLPSMPRWAGYI